MPFVVAHTPPECTVNTDEWQAYNTLSDTGRTHVQVCHAFGRGEWARDDDGDGIREVHTNSIEGYWTGLRNFLRPFRGVNKEHLSHYIAFHEWASNLKQVLEAMACGTAVACSNVSSLPEVVGDAARLFDPLDVDEMTRVLRAVLTGPATRAALETRGLARSRMFSWRASAAQTLDVLRMAAEEAHA